MIADGEHSQVADGVTSTCNLKFQITGIEVGDEFVLVGPCIVQLDQPVSFGVKLKDGSVVEDPDDVLSRAGIVTDNGSELHIRRTDDGSSFSDHDVRQEGVIKNGILRGDEEIGAFEFIDEGLYELELIWFEPSPPDASGPPVEVSRATKKVIAGDLSNVASGLGMALFELLEQVCPPSAPGSVICQSSGNVRNEFDNGAWGTIRCDGTDGFVADAGTINRQEIRDYIVATLPSADPDTVDILLVHLDECALRHEERHVDWFKTNAPDACDGCCCFHVPSFPDSQSCIDSEEDAYQFGGNPCLGSKLPVLQPSLSTAEYNLLRDVHQEWIDRVSHQNYGC